MEFLVAGLLWLWVWPSAVSTASAALVPGSRRDFATAVRSRKAATCWSCWRLTRSAPWRADWPYVGAMNVAATTGAGAGEGGHPRRPGGGPGTGPGVGAPSGPLV